MASVAFLVAVLVAAFLAHRFTTPLTRLTEASRRLADGDLASRVDADELSTGTLEMRELEPAVQRDGGPARGERQHHPPRP